MEPQEVMVGSRGSSGSKHKALGASVYNEVDSKRFDFSRCEIHCTYDHHRQVAHPFAQLTI